MLRVCNMFETLCFQLRLSFQLFGKMSAETVRPLGSTTLTKYSSCVLMMRMIRVSINLISFNHTQKSVKSALSFATPALFDRCQQVDLTFDIQLWNLRLHTTMAAVKQAASIPNGTNFDRTDRLGNKARITKMGDAMRSQIRWSKIPVRLCSCIPMRAA